ncbi:hypothetical protein ACTFIT_011468 [Dictyostelium discoideum]
MELIELSFQTKFECDSIFGIIKSKNIINYDLLKSIVFYLYEVQLKINLTKEHFLIIKEKFKDERFKSLESMFIETYKDYLIQAYDNNEDYLENDNNFESKIFNLIKDSFEDINSPFFNILPDIISLNLNNLNNKKFLIKILNYILLKDFKNYKDNRDNCLRLIIIVLLMDKIGIEYYKENIKEKIIEILRSIDNRNFIAPSPHSEKLYKLIDLYDDDNNNNNCSSSNYDDEKKQINEIIWRLLYIEDGNNHHLNQSIRLSLKYNKKIKIFKFKQQRKKLIKTILSSDSIIKTFSNDEILISKNLNKLLLLFIEPIVMNYEGNGLFEFLLNYFKLFSNTITETEIETTTTNLNSHEIIKSIEILKKYLNFIPFNITLEIINNISLENVNEFLKDFNFFSNLNSSINYYDQNYEIVIKSIFKFNESLLLLLGNDFKMFLSESYKRKFNLILKFEKKNFHSIIINNENIFSNIHLNPIKFNFFKSILNYLLNSLPIGIINKYLLPIFENECLNSKIYKIKLNNQLLINNSNNEKEINQLIKLLPNYLKLSILNELISLKSLTMFERLEYSLINKSIFNFTISILNNSKLIPIEINLNNFSLFNLSSQYSLVKSYAKFIKISHKEVFGNPFKFNPAQFYNYQIYSVNEYHYKEFPVIREFNEIEILDLKGELSIADFNYFNNSKDLKKLIIKTTNSIANQFHNELIHELQNQKGIEIELHLQNGIQISAFNPFSIIQQSFVSLPFLSKEWYLLYGSKSKKINLQIPEWFGKNGKGNQENNQIKGLENVLSWIKKSSNNNNNFKIDWSNVNSIHFEFLFSKCSKYLKIEFLVKLFQLFTINNLNEIIISFPFIKEDPKVSIEIIINTISNFIPFSNVSTILIDLDCLAGYCNFGYIPIEDWELYNFTQVEGYNNNFLKFIKIEPFTPLNNIIPKTQSTSALTSTIRVSNPKSIQSQTTSELN